MSRRYKIKDLDKAYFITMTTVGWIDVFTRFSHRNTLIDSLKYCQQNKGLEIYAYVIMPSHIHMLCRCVEGYDLRDTLRDFKKFTSRQLVENIQNEPESRREWMIELFHKACSHLTKDMNYKVWQDGYHGIEVHSPGVVYQKLEYIHMNPVVERIVEHPWDYLYSSARNYADLDSLIDVEVLPHKPMFLTKL